MRYEGEVSIYFGMWCAQFVWIYFRCTLRECIIRNIYFIRSEHYKSHDRLLLKNVSKGTYKLLCRKIYKIFYRNPRGRSLLNISC
jgi:hypothetical protein